jgi:hypothetical protein
MMLRDKNPSTSWRSANTALVSTALSIPSRFMRVFLSVAVGFCVLVSLLSFGCLTVRADELPEDPREIESLTPRQARKLAREFAGVVFFEIEIKGVMRSQTNRCLPLNRLRSLDLGMTPPQFLYQCL